MNIVETCQLFVPFTKWYYRDILHDRTKKFSDNITIENQLSQSVKLLLFLYCVIIMSPLRRHIFVCFMAKSAFWEGFSALSP